MKKTYHNMAHLGKIMEVSMKETVENLLYWRKAVLKQWLDGDTAKVIIDLGFNRINAEMTIRMAGIDTPEIHSDNSVERKLASKALKICEDQIPVNSTFLLKTQKPYPTDKYGRWIGHFFLLNNMALTLNVLLLDAHLALPYNGGKKNSQLVELLLPYNQDVLQ